MSKIQRLKAKAAAYHAAVLAVPDSGKVTPEAWSKLSDGICDLMEEFADTMPEVIAATADSPRPHADDQQNIQELRARVRSLMTPNATKPETAAATETGDSLRDRVKSHMQRE